MGDNGRRRHLTPKTLILMGILGIADSRYYSNETLTPLNRKKKISRESERPLTPQDDFIP
jgi:hypothetical protein